MRAFRQLSRPVLGLRRSMCQKRSFYEAKGHFATINDRGVLVSSETDIYVGDPHEAYVSIMPDVGEAIRACVARQKDMGLAGQQDAKTLPMVFDHATRSFYHESVQLPRLEIKQDLPRQNGTDMSPATLWLSGCMHSISLNGPFEDFFEREARKTVEDPKRPLEALKNT